MRHWPHPQVLPFPSQPVRGWIVMMLAYAGATTAAAISSRRTAADAATGVLQAVAISFPRRDAKTWEESEGWGTSRGILLVERWWAGAAVPPDAIRAISLYIPKPPGIDVNLYAYVNGRALVSCDVWRTGRCIFFLLIFSSAPITKKILLWSVGCLFTNQ